MKSLHILIVDDNSVNQKILSYFIAKWGMSYGLAGDGQEALEYIEMVKVDLVLMDIMMPIMGGIECTLKIRSHNGKSINSVPIIGVSANPESAPEALDAGMNDFVCKPVNFPELLKKIKEHSSRGKRDSIFYHEGV
jgi:CheY-like chemotaxis protein